jgi:hypothetical protein
MKITKRIAAIALALCACTVQAQQPAMGTLTVTVKDVTTALFPGARITITNKLTGTRFEAKADANGQAVFHLVQGRYELKVQAIGFYTWEEKDLEVKAEKYRDDVTLAVAPTIDVLIIESPFFPVEFEHLVLTSEIPLIPIQQFELTAKSFRYRWHWS